MEYVTASRPFHFDVQRFAGNPLIYSGMPGLTGDQGGNINGPSLIRAPDWVAGPLGKYYLYFAHHQGTFIRLAYADQLAGPWTIHRDGVHLAQVPGPCGREGEHVASPDVHRDRGNRRVLLYYHGLAEPGADIPHPQGSYAAVSDDGLKFESRSERLGSFYFRVFRHRDSYHYAFAKNGNDAGILYRSRNGLSDFEEGPRILPRVRHMALWPHAGMLYVFFSRGGDRPERILVSRVENLQDDWSAWRFTEPRTVLQPERDYEGANEPMRASEFGAVSHPVHQLRDPAIFEEGNRVFLFYAAAGENAIAAAEITLREG